MKLEVVKIKWSTISLSIILWVCVSSVDYDTIFHTIKLKIGINTSTNNCNKHGYTVYMVCIKLWMLYTRVWYIILQIRVGMVSRLFSGFMNRLRKTNMSAEVPKVVEKRVTDILAQDDEPSLKKVKTDNEVSGFLALLYEQYGISWVSRLFVIPLLIDVI